MEITLPTSEGEKQRAKAEDTGARKTRQQNAQDWGRRKTTDNSKFGSIKDHKEAFEKMTHQNLGIPQQHHYIATEESLQPLPMISKGLAMVQEQLECATASCAHCLLAHSNQFQKATRPEQSQGDEEEDMLCKSSDQVWAVAQSHKARL